MNPNENPLSVEGLLEDAQFSVPPTFQAALHQKLKQNLAASALESGVRQRQNGNYPGVRRVTWRWAAIGFATLCLVLVAMTATVPAVRAQVLTLLERFGVALPAGRQGIIVGPFTPLAPATAPAQLPNLVAYNQESDGRVYIEQRYFSQDTFAVLYETPAQAGEVLPPGALIRIGENNAVLNERVNGLIYLAEQAPQPWRQPVDGGGGGGGGSLDDGQGAPPKQLVYASAIELTWIQSGLHVELTTNLPKEEALRLAASLKPAPQLEKP